jgi:branched-chain amino acid transport system permease protein
MTAAAEPASTQLNARKLLQEAGWTAFLVFMLALPMGGFETVGRTVGLSLRVRPLYVIVPVVIAFVGRLVLLLMWRRSNSRDRGQRQGQSVMDQVARKVSTSAVYFMPVILLFAAVLPFLPFSNRYLIDTATSVLIYIMLGWGLNIVVGLAGLLDLGYVAFYAVGAYSYALLATEFGWSFWTCLPLAGLFAAFAGIVLGFPVLRLRGDYLAIVTLGFGEIIRLILLNWYKVTNGPDGISQIPRPSFFGLEFTRRPEEGVQAFHQYFDIPYSGEHRVIFLYFLILALALLTNIFTQRIRKLPIGRAWEALREDEIACRSLGINPTNTKLTAFGLGAMFGGFAGAFFATRQGFISPESFTFIESAIILAIVVLGGMGSQIGVVLAAVVLIVLPELGRALEQFRMLVFGGAMVAIMVWRPRGLLAYREPTILLQARRRGERS